MPHHLKPSVCCHLKTRAVEVVCDGLPRKSSPSCQFFLAVPKDVSSETPVEGSTRQFHKCLTAFPVQTLGRRAFYSLHISVLPPFLIVTDLLVYVLIDTHGGYRTVFILFTVFLWDPAQKKQPLPAVQQWVQQINECVLSLTCCWLTIWFVLLLI